jgi:hypothetical protein
MYIAVLNMQAIPLHQDLRGIARADEKIAWPGDKGGDDHCVGYNTVVVLTTTVGRFSGA